MTDQEIWEYMQRDLDGDLSLAEKQQLHDILLKDPGMQLMYNRMKNVSAQLAQLPPVTPRFSIVDSILPQLEAEKVKPAAAISGQQHILPKLEPKQSTEKIISFDEQPKWKRIALWTARIGSGIVAASLLIGVMFIGGHLKPQPDEDNYQHGAVIEPPEEDTPSLVGPPPPPPSNHSSESVEPVVEKDPPKRQTKQPIKQQKNQTPDTKTPSPPPNQATPEPPKPDPNLPKPPVKPVMPVQEHTPSFPVGVEVLDKDAKKEQKEKEKEQKDQEKKQEKAEKEKQKDEEKTKKEQEKEKEKDQQQDND
ncbi:hypothetical protein NDK47_17290 [Brevibacillus ruminantium]|uniref:Anti-sigma factor n=1 Tax=Brevibacillus ruminantium TaxID=2950604 RepID=A0ABY4W9N0_9BACL|nr:hypothetical protein [Brevibacillus ruminantium]USG63906.1 hypothetical protein NDK47_17290 [Brevibacillus ruminantium]